MQSNENLVDIILDKMQKQNSTQQLNDGLNILAKLVQNVIQNPYQTKYRQVKITNNTIKSKLMVLTNIELLLQRLGYVKQNEETYTLKDQQIGEFLQGSPAIDYRKRLISARLTSQAAYDKQIQLIRNHKQQRAEQAKRKLQSNRLKQQCQDDKMQRKHMKVDTTKSNDLKFGTKTNTYKDIGVDLCAQKGK